MTASGKNSKGNRIRPKLGKPKVAVFKITDLNANFATLVAIPLWACEAGFEPGSPMGGILAEANLVLGWKRDVPIALPMGHKGIPIEDLVASIRKRRFTKPEHRAVPCS